MLISLVVIAVLFALIFKYLPDIEIAWRDVWVGAAITALLFVAGKFGIGLYLGTSDVGSAYGAAGSLIVILVWIYYSALILFFGAELTQAWSVRGGRPTVDASVIENSHAKRGGVDGMPRREPAGRLVLGAFVGGWLVGRKPRS